MKNLLIFTGGAILGGLGVVILQAFGVNENIRNPEEGSVIHEDDNLKVIQTTTHREGDAFDLAVICYKKNYYNM
jgi:hypothetical protein